MEHAGKQASEKVKWNTCKNIQAEKAKKRELFLKASSYYKDNNCILFSNHGVHHGKRDPW
jgi:hypothetical protein